MFMLYADVSITCSCDANVRITGSCYMLMSVWHGRQIAWIESMHRPTQHPQGQQGGQRRGQRRGQEYTVGQAGSKHRYSNQDNMSHVMETYVCFTLLEKQTRNYMTDVVMNLNHAGCQMTPAHYEPAMDNINNLTFIRWVNHSLNPVWFTLSPSGCFNSLSPQVHFTTSNSFIKLYVWLWLWLFWENNRIGFISNTNRVYQRFGCVAF